jgi:FkbM family methyltransferase
MGYSLNDFKAILWQEVEKNIYNDYNNNWDYLSFGVEKSPNTFLGKVNAVAGKYFNKKFHAKTVFYLKFKDHFSGLTEMYNLLSNNESKDLYNKVLAYRLLGYKKMMLPLNSTSYWNSYEVVKSCIVDKNNFINPNFLDFILYQHDLQKIGYSINLFLPSLGILIDFVIKQYEYNEDNVLIKAKSGDVVIDAGGCWADTAIYFANEVGINGRVFSFEFIPSNIDIFKQNLSINPTLSNQIILIQNPVWEVSDKILYYTNNGPASRVSDVSFKNYSGTVATLSIDDFVRNNNILKIDFIKMDIEGAEYSALKGSINVIKKFKPVLAIAIYHSIIDMYRIAQFLDSLKLGYKFYFKHATIHAGESVLFAKVS